MLGIKSSVRPFWELGDLGMHWSQDQGAKIEPALAWPWDNHRILGRKLCQVVPQFPNSNYRGNFYHLIVSLWRLKKLAYLTQCLLHNNNAEIKTTFTECLLLCFLYSERYWKAFMRKSNPNYTENNVTNFEGNTELSVGIPLAFLPHLQCQMVKMTWKPDRKWRTNG